MKENKKKKILTKAQREDLEDIIKQGKWNFVSRIGLRFGAIMFLFFFLYDKFIEHAKWDFYDTIFNIVLFGVVGLIFGLLNWRIINKKLNKNI